MINATYSKIEINNFSLNQLFCDHGASSTVTIILESLSINLIMYFINYFFKYIEEINFIYKCIFLYLLYVNSI